MPKMNGSVMLANASSAEEVLELLKTDVYYKESVWDPEKIQVIPVSTASSLAMESIGEDGRKRQPVLQTIVDERICEMLDDANPWAYSSDAPCSARVSNEKGRGLSYLY